MNLFFNIAKKYVDYYERKVEEKEWREWLENNRSQLKCLTSIEGTFDESGDYSAYGSVPPIFIDEYDNVVLYCVTPKNFNVTGVELDGISCHKTTDGGVTHDVFKYIVPMSRYKIETQDDEKKLVMVEENNVKY